MKVPKEGLLGIAIKRADCGWSQTAWAQILALPLTGDVTLSKTLPLLGPQSVHLFLSETPSLFFPSSIPSHVMACPLQTLPSRRRSLLKAPQSSQASGSCKDSVQATGLPWDWLFRVGPRILGNVL